MDHFHDILGEDNNHSKPSSKIDVSSFISARNDEIQSLLNEINVPKKSNVMVFQRLPKKMRRRVMSTTVKRMPKELRSAHKKSIDKQINKHTRRRKDYRKKPKNRRLDFIRRQKNGRWLETHVWFAKRFHMIVKDGYKLPKCSHDKTYRACFRAIGDHCLAQDLSYMNCIELSGPVQIIINGLMHHVHQDCGHTFKAKCYLSGTREGSIFMYKKNSYPYEAVGRVTFIWDTNILQESRSLWIWTDPSIYKQLADELQITFNLKQDIDFNELKPPFIKKVKLTEPSKIPFTTMPFLQTPFFINGNLKMTLLKDTLNRIRLTGPLSNSVLSCLLYPASIFNSKNNEEEWWTTHKTSFKNSVNIQKDLWKTFSGADRPESYPSNCVIGMNTIDPRLVFPEKRKKAMPTSKDFLLPDDCSINLPPEASVSKIWNSQVRNQTTANKLPNNKLNEIRSKYIVTNNDKITLEEHTISVIPILLIQRPGRCLADSRPGYGSGWDVIIPSGWAMPFWLGLIMNGCQPGGLRETNTMILEQCLHQSEDPDTNTGKLKALQRKQTAMEKYFKLPPQMRINHVKLGFKTPFHCAWDYLSKEWKFSTNDLFVLRNKKQILSLKKCTPQLNKNFDIDYVKNILLDVENSLIHVRLKLPFKGVIKPNSHLCLPTPDDIDHIGVYTFKGPVEKLHKDLNEKKRKAYRLEHKKLLRSLRRKRVLEKKKRTVMLNRYKRKISPTSQIVKEYLNEMKKLWIPEEQHQLKNSCDRTILGFISNSHYSFTESHFVGMGYIPSLALLELFNFWAQSKCKLPYILVRHPCTRQYRIALLSLEN
ncbi:ribonucleases P/MRP protein subunit POP1 [Daktulosphaira vitifoliae]|uniref:ribonucleases P/MRP protein subunit POP1 n=1 Tax=Daktulosphaira vitifoliae TaxID=58002 RepID=UPI0021AA885C|nr:ribonucleases P/MRP protein subunit POP1 [Daktulosphaira vitifoliae]